MTIATFARELLTALDDAPRTPQATVQRQWDGLRATFSRDGLFPESSMRLLTLRSAEPISQASAQEWATAMGAPYATLWPTPDRRGWHIEWEVQG